MHFTFKMDTRSLWYRSDFATVTVIFVGDLSDTAI